MGRSGSGLRSGWPPHRHFDRSEEEKSSGRMGLVAGAPNGAVGTGSGIEDRGAVERAF